VPEAGGRGHHLQPEVADGLLVKPVDLARGGDVILVAVPELAAAPRGWRGGGEGGAVSEGISLILARLGAGWRRGK
jgi:hypothetical protein